MNAAGGLGDAAAWGRAASPATSHSCRCACRHTNLHTYSCRRAAQQALPKHWCPNQLLGQCPQRHMHAHLCVQV